VFKLGLAAAIGSPGFRSGAAPGLLALALNLATGLLLWS
jgi:hypothetical protein